MIIRCQGIATCPAQVAILGDCQQSALRERLAVIGAPRCTVTRILLSHWWRISVAVPLVAINTQIRSAGNFQG